MKQLYYDKLEQNPVIAAVKNMEGLKSACEREDICIVFVLFGDICSIGAIVQCIKDRGKIAVVHADLVTGLSGKEIAVDFLKTQTEADGFISTKPPLIKRGRELGLLSILRVFVLDSMALENLNKQIQLAEPDAIEILPGLMPKVIAQVVSCVRIPVIAGGLISEREDVVAALSAGAISVSTSNPRVWMM